MNIQPKNLKSFIPEVTKSFTSSEVAKMLRVKPATVYAWISRRELKANKVGRNQAMSPKQLKDFHELRNNGDYMDHTYL
jgi:excisionase family DNA binding protein